MKHLIKKHLYTITNLSISDCETIVSLWKDEILKWKCEGIALEQIASLLKKEI